MPQSFSQKVANSFTKGLVTDFSIFTFPENASIDELNCDLTRQGTRRRRKAIVKEENSNTSTFSSSSGIVQSFEWESAGGTSGKDFLVIHVSDRLYFYDLAVENTSDAQKTSFSVNLKDYQSSQNGKISETLLDFSVINGILVVVGSTIEAIKIFYKAETDTISSSKINFRIRDVQFQGNTSKYLIPSTEVGQKRKYDTYNAGWTKELLTQYSEYRVATYPDELSEAENTNSGTSGGIQYPWDDENNVGP